MAVLELTDATLDEVVGTSDVPVVVEFTAGWCPPCARFAPVLQAVASEQQGRLVVASVDADDHSATSGRFDVLSLPTVLVFVDGQVRRRLVGARGKAQFLDDLADYL